MSKILIIGSSNTDMVIKTDRFPSPGETIIGGDFFMSMGGKGANQALAAQRLGGEVSFIGKIGKDIFGQKAIDFLKDEGVNVNNVKIDNKKHSGIALIIINQLGENSIVVADSANNSLAPSDILEVTTAIDSCEVLLLQLEIPLETVNFITEYAHKLNKKIILNPAPGRSLPENLYERLSIIVPNENEAEKLTGIKIKDESSAKSASIKLIEKGVDNVIITLGAAGAFLYSEKYIGVIQAPQVKAIDTTGAGDTFCGALSVKVNDNYNLEEAVSFANKAAALSVTRYGAQSSIPTLGEVMNFSG